MDGAVAKGLTVCTTCFRSQYGASICTVYSFSGLNVCTCMFVNNTRYVGKCVKKVVCYQKRPLSLLTPVLQIQIPLT